MIRVKTGVMEIGQKSAWSLRAEIFGMGLLVSIDGGRLRRQGKDLKFGDGLVDRKGSKSQEPGWKKIKAHCGWLLFVEYFEDLEVGDILSMSMIHRWFSDW